MKPQFAEKSVDMRLDCALCNEKLASDFGVGQALANQGIDLSFARRQSRDWIDDRCSRQAERLQECIVPGSAYQKECLVAHVA